MFIPGNTGHLGNANIAIPFEHLLEESQRAQLREKLNVVRYTKRDTIFRRNSLINRILFIQSGLVKVSGKEGTKRSSF